MAYRGLLAQAMVPKMMTTLRWLLAGPSTAGSWLHLELRRELVEAPVGRAQMAR